MRKLVCASLLALCCAACSTVSTYPAGASYRWVARHEPWDPPEYRGASMVDQIPNNQRAADICGVLTNRC